MYDDETLCSVVAVASQQTYLFSDTISANLRIAKANASQAEMVKACRIANIHDFIQSQPAGYETNVGEYGASLSGGQKRRLGVAQALFKNAPILILDEPDEGLDLHAQQCMLNALRDFQKK